jgi:hypothetical protein
VISTASRRPIQTRGSEFFHAGTDFKTLRAKFKTPRLQKDPRKFIVHLLKKVERRFRQSWVESLRSLLLILGPPMTGERIALSFDLSP